MRRQRHATTQALGAAWEIGRMLAAAIRSSISDLQRTRTCILYCVEIGALEIGFSGESFGTTWRDRFF